jgi:hypothetical protein
MEWSKELTLKFIEIYQRCEVIWNPKHKDHFNKLRKNDAWNQIAIDISEHASLEISADECRKKMQTLLSSFRRERMKYRRSLGTGTGMCMKHNTSRYNYE